MSAAVLANISAFADRTLNQLQSITDQLNNDEDQSTTSTQSKLRHLYHSYTTLSQHQCHLLRIRRDQARSLSSKSKSLQSSVVRYTLLNNVPETHPDSIMQLDFGLNQSRSEINELESNLKSLACHKSKLESELEHLNGFLDMPEPLSDSALELAIYRGLGVYFNKIDQRPSTAYMISESTRQGHALDLSAVDAEDCTPRHVADALWNGIMH